MDVFFFIDLLLYLLKVRKTLGDVECLPLSPRFNVCCKDFPDVQLF